MWEKGEEMPARKSPCVHVQRGALDLTHSNRSGFNSSCLWVAQYYRLLGLERETWLSLTHSERHQVFKYFNSCLVKTALSFGFHVYLSRNTLSPWDLIVLLQDATKHEKQYPPGSLLACKQCQLMEISMFYRGGEGMQRSMHFIYKCPGYILYLDMAQLWIANILY